MTDNATLLWQYTGGLDRVSENEGKLALLWQSEVAQETRAAALQVALFFVVHFCNGRACAEHKPKRPRLCDRMRTESNASHCPPIIRFSRFASMSQR